MHCLVSCFNFFYSNNGSNVAVSAYYKWNSWKDLFSLNAWPGHHRCSHTWRDLSFQLVWGFGQSNKHLQVSEKVQNSRFTGIIIYAFIPHDHIYIQQLVCQQATHQTGHIYICHMAFCYYMYCFLLVNIITWAKNWMLMVDHRSCIFVNIFIWILYMF